MNKKKSLYLFFFSIFIACQARTDSSITKGETAKDPSLLQSAGASNHLTNRVWVRSDSTGLPGIARAFFTNGTLLLDSCWETYRLSRWQMKTDSTLVWSEDSIDIRADILTLNEKELVLKLNLTDESIEERYTAASVPYICPDMPR